VFTNKKREGIYAFVCAVSLYATETPKAPIKDHEPPLPIIPSGIVAFGFFGQPFSKQLYNIYNLDVEKIQTLVFHIYK